MRRESTAKATCRICGESFDSRRRDAEGRAVGLHKVRTCPRHRWARRGVLVDRSTPYEQDIAAQLFVRVFPGPDGATLEDVAEAMGISRERVRQIEERALAKLRDLSASGQGFVVEHFRRARPAPRHDRAGGRDESAPEADAELDAIGRVVDPILDGQKSDELAEDPEPRTDR